MMNKAKNMSQSLMDEAAAYFVNLKNTGTWKTEISRNIQIIVLTTKISELKANVTNRLTGKAPKKNQWNQVVVLELASPNTFLIYGALKRFATLLSTT
jgi:hypothetical protein